MAFTIANIASGASTTVGNVYIADSKTSTVPVSSGISWTTINIMSGASESVYYGTCTTAGTITFNANTTVSEITGAGLPLVQGTGTQQTVFSSTQGMTITMAAYSNTNNFLWAVLGGTDPGTLGPAIPTGWTFLNNNNAGNGFDRVIYKNGGLSGFSTTTNFTISTSSSTGPFAVYGYFIELTAGSVTPTYKASQTFMVF